MLTKADERWLESIERGTPHRYEPPVSAGEWLGLAATIVAFVLAMLGVVFGI
jgi:hypothetical protein